jgi:ammonium transporter Rh
MKTKLTLSVAMFLILASVSAFAGEAAGQLAEGGLRQVEQYNFSIHVLAMLLVGFGFLMVFVRNYGYSATTGTYLVVAAGLPLYLFLRSTGIVSAEAVSPDSIKALLLAEFACAAALISMGPSWDASGFINTPCWPLWQCPPTY